MSASFLAPAIAASVSPAARRILIVAESTPIVDEINARVATGLPKPGPFGLPIGPPCGSLACSAASAAASAAAAAASYDSFDDRYLGPKASNPSVDNDGNALVAGALYWNTTDNSMKVWSGSSWGGITSAVTSSRWSKTAAGGETTLNGTDNNSVTLSYTVGYEQVYLNGVLLVRGDDYTASNGSSITGIAALTAGDIVEVLSWTPYSVANALTVTTIDAKGDLLVGTASDTIGRLAVGTNGYILTADSSQTQGIKWAAAPEAGFNPLMLMGA